MQLAMTNVVPEGLPEGYFKELKWFHHFKGFCGSLVTMLYGTELRTVSYRI
jgi:hypothetical protein